MSILKPEALKSDISTPSTTPRFDLPPEFRAEMRKLIDGWFEKEENRGDYSSFDAGYDAALLNISDQLEELLS
jgi:hypothetical protein